MPQTSSQTNKTTTTNKPTTAKTSTINLEHLPLKTFLKSLKHYSNEDLQKVMERIQSLIKRREKSQRKADLLKVQELVKKHDFDPSEIQ